MFPADIGGEEVGDIFSKAGSSPHSTGTNATGGSEGVDSAFGSGKPAVGTPYHTHACTALPGWLS